MPERIIVRRIDIVQRIKHQRNIKTFISYHTSPIADPQQQARRIDTLMVFISGTPRSSRSAGPVELRLRRQEQKREHISPAKNTAAIDELLLTDIIVIIKSR